MVSARDVNNKPSLMAHREVERNVILSPQRNIKLPCVDTKSDEQWLQGNVLLVEKGHGEKRWEHLIESSAVKEGTAVELGNGQRWQIYLHRFHIWRAVAVCYEK